MKSAYLAVRVPIELHISNCIENPQIIVLADGTHAVVEPSIALPPNTVVDLAPDAARNLAARYGGEIVPITPEHELNHWLGEIMSHPRALIELRDIALSLFMSGFEPEEAHHILDGIVAGTETKQ